MNLMAQQAVVVQDVMSDEGESDTGMPGQLTRQQQRALLKLMSEDYSSMSTVDNSLDPGDASESEFFYDAVDDVDTNQEEELDLRKEILKQSDTSNDQSCATEEGERTAHLQSTYATTHDLGARVTQIKKMMTCQETASNNENVSKEEDPGNENDVSARSSSNSSSEESRASEACAERIKDGANLAPQVSGLSSLLNKKPHAYNRERRVQFSNLDHPNIAPKSPGIDTLKSRTTGGREYCSELFTLNERKLKCDSHTDINRDSSCSKDSQCQQEERSEECKNPSQVAFDRGDLLRPNPRRPSSRGMQALKTLKDETRSMKEDFAKRTSFNFGRSKSIRLRRKIDMETEATATREFTAVRRTEKEYLEPMNPKERRKKMFLKMRSLESEEVAHQSYDHDLQNGRRRLSLWRKTSNRKFLPFEQFHLRSMIEKDENNLLPFSDECFGLVRTYLHWCFRASFILVFVSEAFFFIAWCLFFGVAYYLIGTCEPKCIIGNNFLNFEENNMGFTDAFTLGWSTFSTVGYGSVYPRVNGPEARLPLCILTTILCSTASFVGVLFASFLSAILFAKVARAQSIAQVVFSESIVIRFGQELVDDESLGDSQQIRFQDSYGSQNDAQSKHRGIHITQDNRKKKRNISHYPCPILEFRVANVLHDQKGGEIMNCKLNAIASTTEMLSNADEDEEQKTKKRKDILRSLQSKVTIPVQTMKNTLSKGGTVIQMVNKTITESAKRLADTSHRSQLSSELQPKKDTEPWDGKDIGLDLFESKEFAQNLTSHDYESSRDLRRSPRIASLVVDEEPGNDGTRRVFSKLDIETDSHPFLKRLWTIRHILNESSPLLSAKAQRLVRTSGGLWPAAQCNRTYIRENLDFSQVIVTLSGTAVLSGRSVYSLKTYEPSSTEIGRVFECALALKDDDMLTVDLQRISKTKEQVKHVDNDTVDSNSFSVKRSLRQTLRKSGKNMLVKLHASFTGGSDSHNFLGESHRFDLQSREALSSPLETTVEEKDEDEGSSRSFCGD